MVTKKELGDALKKHFGFDTFKGNQEAIILSLLEEKDTFVLMPTGGGKSLCYQLPALLMDGTAIVISPLIALMKNQVDAMRNYSSSDSIAHFLNSTLSKSAIEQVKDDIVEGKTKLLYVPPESLTKEDNIEFLKSIKISFYAVDEAHCISEWGHDFRPEYRRIRPIIQEISLRPVIALTATATPKVQHDIQKNLGMQNANLFKSSFNRSNLYYEIRQKTSNVDKDIIRYIKSNPGKSGIIYCLSRKKVEELADLLAVNQIQAHPYHAGMDAATRAMHQDDFILEKVNVIVATIAFGMGIDKPDVRYVIHYDIPKSLEGYYQETGRAGRDGGEGHCIAYYSHKDVQKLEKIIQGKQGTEQEIGKQLLQETVNYAESSVCRRKTLLHYFGEEYEKDNCGNCDNCSNPLKQVEAKDELCAIIETIVAIKEKFKPSYIIDIVTGKQTADIKTYGHDALEVFGCLSHSDEKFLNSVIRQAILAGYLDKEIENYGVIKLTSSGKKYLAHPKSFKVKEDNVFSDEEEPVMLKGGASCAVDPTLYNILKDLRKKIAKHHNLPPYVIFQDPSLEAMATTYPITIEELAVIPGVGMGKAQRYGSEFVRVIKEHVEENEIERPDDLRVRSLPKPNNERIAIVTSIDRRIALDEIAESKGMEFSELLNIIESIVMSGNKININYFIDEVLDQETQEDIFNFFKESESDNLDEAIQEFGNECTEEEIRLVRIKFISEMGN